MGLTRVSWELRRRCVDRRGSHPCLLAGAWRRGERRPINRENLTIAPLKAASLASAVCGRDRPAHLSITSISVPNPLEPELHYPANAAANSTPCARSFSRQGSSIEPVQWKLRRSFARRRAGVDGRRHERKAAIRPRPLPGSQGISTPRASGQMYFPARSRCRSKAGAESELSPSRSRRVARNVDISARQLRRLNDPSASGRRGGSLPGRHR